jgi:hypothetical protein
VPTPPEEYATSERAGSAKDDESAVAVPKRKIDGATTKLVMSVWSHPPG